MRRNDYTDIEITLLQKEAIPYSKDTIEYAQTLSSRAREIAIRFKGTTLFNILVPKDIYNPYGNRNASLLLDMVMSQEIDVVGKSLVDLGCGSGILGLTATLQGCQQVLYTDINPGAIAIQTHPLFRACDRVQIQNFCRSEAEGSYDLVVMCPPTDLLPRQPQMDNYEGAVYREPGFMEQMVKEVSRVLCSGGHFVFTYWVYPNQIDQLVSLIANLGYYLFDRSIECLLQVPEGEHGTRCIFSAYRK